MTLNQRNEVFTSTVGHKLVGYLDFEEYNPEILIYFSYVSN